MQMVRYCVPAQGTERLIRRGIVGKSFSYFLALDSEAWKTLNLIIWMGHEAEAAHARDVPEHECSAYVCRLTWIFEPLKIDLWIEGAWLSCAASLKSL